MIRSAIVTEAARRLGDTSTAFLADVDAAFDFVLQDLAAHEAIGDLRRLHSTAVTVQSQRDYDTRTLTGLPAPYYPDELVSLRVWSWGWAGLLERLSDVDFEAHRATEGDVEGRPHYWRLYPNNRNVQLHPVAEAASAGATIEVLYTIPPTIIAGGAELDEVRYEDIETIVFGLKARLAGFVDETVQDAGTDWQLYIAGRDRMWGRKWNRGVGQMAITW